MARVVPSQVVELIDKLFSSANFEKKFSLDYSHTPQLAAIVSLVKQIPPELIALTGNSYVKFDLRDRQPEVMSRAPWAS